MKFQQLRQVVEELYRGHPEIDDAEVKINIGHSVVGFDEISHFISEEAVVLSRSESDQAGPGDRASGKCLGVTCESSSSRRTNVSLLSM